MEVDIHKKILELEKQNRDLITQLRFAEILEHKLKRELLEAKKLLEELKQ